MLVSSIGIDFPVALTYRVYASLKMYFPIKPQGKAMLLALSTVPSIATEGIELPRSLM